MSRAAEGRRPRDARAARSTPLTRRSAGCGNCSSIASLNNSPAEEQADALGYGNPGTERTVQRSNRRYALRSATNTPYRLACTFGRGATILRPRHGAFGQPLPLRQRDARRPAGHRLCASGTGAQLALVAVAAGGGGVCSGILLARSPRKSE